MSGVEARLLGLTHNVVVTTHCTLEMVAPAFCDWRPDASKWRWCWRCSWQDRRHESVALALHQQRQQEQLRWQQQLLQHQQKQE